MFEFIVGLALIPFALVGILLLLGILAFTWKYLVAGLLFLMSLAIVLPIPGLEYVYKVVILYIIAAVLYAVATQRTEDTGSAAYEADRVKHIKPISATVIDDENAEAILSFIQKERRFTFLEIKRLMHNKKNTMDVINRLVRAGNAKPEGMKAPMHWILTDSEE